MDSEKDSIILLPLKHKGLKLHKEKFGVTCCLRDFAAIYGLIGILNPGLVIAL